MYFVQCLSAKSPFHQTNFSIMKKIKTTGRAFLLLLAAGSLFTACDKNSSDNNFSADEIQKLTITSQADAEADVTYDEVFDNVMGVNDDAGVGGNIGVFGGRVAANGTTGADLTAARTSSPPACLTVTISPQTPGVFPKTITLDFGTGCTSQDGHTRRGKMITVYSGRLVIPGSTATTTFVDFYRDSVKVEGTHTITNVSTSNNQSFTTTVNNGRLTRPSGDYIAWNKTKTWVQVEGNGTPNVPIDDVYSITGTANGTVQRGNISAQWSTEITTPIIRKFTCRWAVKGEKKIIRNSVTAVLNYGSGACDNLATVLINGNLYNIVLP